MGFFISLCIALLSGMGVGGGGLFALYLKLFTHMPQLKIQTFNLIFFLFASGTALLVHLRRRKLLLLPIGIMLFFGIIGSLLGSMAALALDGNILSKIFGSMMLFVGIFSLFKNKK